MNNCHLEVTKAMGGRASLANACDTSPSLHPIPTLSTPISWCPELCNKGAMVWQQSLFQLSILFSFLLKRISFLHHSYLSVIQVWQKAFLWHKTGLGFRRALATCSKRKVSISCEGRRKLGLDSGAEGAPPPQTHAQNPLLFHPSQFQLPSVNQGLKILHTIRHFGGGKERERERDPIFT